MVHVLVIIGGGGRGSNTALEYSDMYGAQKSAFRTQPPCFAIARIAFQFSHGGRLLPSRSCRRSWNSL